MGNTVVLKPSPLTPLEGLVLGAVAAEADLPPGVLNIVTGEGDVGDALVTDPRVDMISFTGSEGTGKSVMAGASDTLKRVVLELGGKSAIIVREDADVEAAAATAFGSFTLHAGQGCVLLTRHLVHQSVADEFVAALDRRVKQTVLGDPGDPATDHGSARLGGAEGEGARLHRLRSRGRRRGRFPRIRDRVGWLLRASGGPAGCAAELTQRAGRDLRPGRGRPAIRGRRRGCSARQRQSVRTFQRDLQRQQRSGLPDGRAAAHRRSSDQRWRHGARSRGADDRLEAPPAWGPNTVSRACWSTPSRRSVAFRAGR